MYQMAHDQCIGWAMRQLSCGRAQASEPRMQASDDIRGDAS